MAFVIFKLNIKPEEMETARRNYMIGAGHVPKGEFDNPEYSYTPFDAKTYDAVNDSMCWGCRNSLLYCMPDDWYLFLIETEDYPIYPYIYELEECYIHLGIEYRAPTQIFFSDIKV